MVMDANQTYRGDRATIYTITESLHCTFKTNIILNVNYSSITKEEKGRLVTFVENL